MGNKELREYAAFDEEINLRSLDLASAVAECARGLVNWAPRLHNWVDMSAVLIDDEKDKEGAGCS
jgi:hypothetical protein